MCIHGLTILWLDMQNGETPLHDAASAGDSSTAKLLLEAGAEVMARKNVRACVTIAWDLSDVCSSRYGKHWFRSAKIIFCYMLACIYTRWWWRRDEYRISNSQCRCTQVDALLGGYYFLWITQRQSRCFSIYINIFNEFENLKSDWHRMNWRLIKQRWQ